MHVISYRESIGRLQPAIEPLCDALTEGLKQANELHAKKSLLRKLDPWFYTHAVRRVACDELRTKGLVAELDGSERPALAMSGILLHYRDMAIKVLRPTVTKSGTPQIPIPGRSARRQAFWRQEPTLPGLETENLLLVWWDDQGSLVEPMILARPLGGNHRCSSLELDWDGTLSRSMARLRAEDLDELRPDHTYRRLGDEKAG
jgi:hypothetical protein